MIQLFQTIIVRVAGVGAEGAAPGEYRPGASLRLIPATRRKSMPRRRGVTVVIVLGLLAIALAVSYSMLRSQMVTTQIQGNLGRMADARQAARTGISAALREMHESTWQGVDVPLSGSLDSNQSYRVTYTTGDPSLKASDPNYGEYPYRVTLTSTGTSVDPSNSAIKSSYTVQVVVELIRRKFADEPAVWSTIQNYTIYQWENSDIDIEFPVHTEGALLLQGKIRLCEKYPDNSNARESYLAGLEAMRGASLGDHRPMQGPITMPLNRTPASTRALLTDQLNVSLTDIIGSDSAPFSHPGIVSQYQLYPGGKLYDVTDLLSDYGGSLTGVTITPDVLTNPLGIYDCQGDLKLYDNVVIQGTIITSVGGADIHIHGSGVRIEAVDLPSLDGATNKVQLPVAIIYDDIHVEDSTDGSMTGMAAVWDKFKFQTGNATATFDFQGRLMTGELNLKHRWQWNIGTTQWVDELADFNAQLGDSNPVKYFPQWMEKQRAMVAKPLLTIKPQSGAVTYHWQNWTEPIYVVHADDEGLRWNLIDWQENP